MGVRGHEDLFILVQAVISLTVGSQEQGRAFIYNGASAGLPTLSLGCWCCPLFSFPLYVGDNRAAALFLGRVMSLLLFLYWP